MNLLLKKPKLMKSPTILVPFESWIFLQDRSKIERLGKCMDEKQRNKMEHTFECHSLNGMKQLMNGYLGGCNGDPENAWEEHRWTSWNIDDMKKILDEAGLPWVDGEEQEYIAI